ncbi:cob(I)yrinic acid a,c-diamide adenosyltransferase [Candidatus Pacearchaeota archaeon CG10_big_fil_rev_8_21_14_0_10_34_12]|nr:MAG: cob(I)yrinic acid a,c-diamide adenosyltransferase [Candidatus Pacearchaeota archaeon CG10_big_fil_rev_8_21_14_0_10_34_12]
MAVDKQKLGLVHIYTGEGKGKTSAGMGLIVRALGRGLKVKVIQLFKRDTGEQFFFENSSVRYVQFKPLHPYFTNYSLDDLEDLKKNFLEFWEGAIKDMEEYDMILVDEIGPGINWGVIPEKSVIEFIENKPKNTELILTGRDFPDSVKEKADYISEINKVKHPYDSGVLAREGVEF